MLKKTTLFLLLIFTVAWCFSQTSEFEEFNTHYKLAHKTNTQSALQHAFKALTIANNLKNDSLAASAKVAISYTYRTLGNLTSALDYALKAENFYKNIKDPIGHTVLYMQIGGIYSEFKNYGLAIKYYYQALNLKIDNVGLVLPIYVNLGDVYREIEQFDSALHYFNKAKIIGNKNNYNYYDGYIYCNSGLVYAAQGKKHKADSLLNLSFKILKANEDFRPIAIIYKELAKINMKNNNIEKAYYNAYNAYKIADSNLLITELKEISLLLSEINNKKRNYKKAYEYLWDYNNYNKKITADSVVSKLAEMRAEFEISQNETEMQYLKDINRFRLNLLIITLLSLFLIALLTLFLFKVNKKRKQANHQLSGFNQELKQKNIIIKQALDDKEVLIKEIHHRVKNNLQIISSIINLQSMQIENTDTQEVFNEMQRRILAISSIHQKLYSGDSVSLINMKDYLGEVVESIHMAFNNNKIDVGYEIAIQNVKLDIDAAVSIGLIVNELTTNAYKYAFKPNRENMLVLTLIQNQQNNIELTFKDNGSGMQKNFDIEATESLGLRMVNLLTRQQKGTLEYKNDNGAMFSILFRKNNK